MTMPASARTRKDGPRWGGAPTASIEGTTDLKAKMTSAAATATSPAAIGDTGIAGAVAAARQWSTQSWSGAEGTAGAAHDALPQSMRGDMPSWLIDIEPIADAA